MMNKLINVQLDDRKRLLIILSIFPLTLILLLIFRETIREWIVIPLLYLFWFFNQAVLELYQGILWFIFIIFVLFFVYFSLKGFAVYKEQYDGKRRENIESGRVKYWSNLLNLAGRGILSLPYVSSQLREELFALIAYRQNIRPIDVERQVESGEFFIPEDVRRFIFIKNNFHAHDNFFTEIKNFWRSLLPLKRRTNRDWIMKNIERTIEYMEEIMEVNDDHANR
jgi:hypothetical protein